MWGKLLLLGQTSWVVDKWSAPDADGEAHLIQEIDVYALSGENLHAFPRDASHHAYRLNGSVVRVRVTLSAENMPEQVFQFRIVRTDDGGITSVDVM